ncbi:MAG: hypothetical protein ACE3L7_12705 [Candidatus Pristimantibacillus sp.]
MEGNTSALNYLQTNVNHAFKGHLGLITTACFSVNLEGGNSGEYDKCIASVATAAGLSNLSSYEEENDLIDVVLQNFYGAMLVPENKAKLIQDSEKIRGLFVRLLMNPSDIETTTELSHYVESLNK